MCATEQMLMLMLMLSTRCIESLGLFVVFVSCMTTTGLRFAFMNCISYIDSLPAAFIRLQPSFMAHRRRLHPGHSLATGDRLLCHLHWPQGIYWHITHVLSGYISHKLLEYMLHVLMPILLMAGSRTISS